MAKFANQSSDPFIASQEREHDGYLLLEALTREGITPSSLGEQQKLSAIPTGPWEQQQRHGRGLIRRNTNISTIGESGVAQPLLGTRSETFKRAALARVTAALVGAVFLVGPMWALVLKQDSVYFQLGFTTACVLVFGLIMAWYLETVDKVFSVTLAYAAVLMVFIGVMMERAVAGGVATE